MNPAMILALIQASPELLADAVVISTELTKLLTDLQAFMVKVRTAKDSSGYKSA